MWRWESRKLIPGQCEAQSPGEGKEVDNRFRGADGSRKLEAWRLGLHSPASGKQLSEGSLCVVFRLCSGTGNMYVTGIQ